MAFALSLLSHGPSLSAMLAALAALVVIGIVAGAPDNGAAGDGGAPADGDAGDGGSDDRGGAPDDGADGSGDGRDGLHADGGQGDDDDDDADAGLSEEVRNDPKRLRTHRRRIQRQLATVRPIAERFRDPGTGQFMPPQQIDQMIGRARDMGELEEFFQEHPDIIQLIAERRRRGGQSAAAAAAEEAFVDPFIDPKFKAAWDTDTPEGRQLLDLFRDRAKETFDLRQTVKRLEQTLQGVTQRDTTRTIAGVEQTWRTATITAAAQVPEVSRRTFVNSVWRAFELAKTRGQLGKVNLKRLIEAELDPYVRANRGQRRTTVASQQTRAELNTTIPRPGRGQTTAASPRDTNKANTGTIRDARKSFFARIDQSAPR